MSDNEIGAILQSTAGRASLMQELQKADALQLMNAVKALAGAPKDVLWDAYQSGWIHCYLAECQIRLKRLAHRFTHSHDLRQFVRLVRDSSNHGLLNELETFELPDPYTGRYFLKPEDMTLNIQLEIYRDYSKPCYMVPLAEIQGYLVDNVDDFPTDIMNNYCNMAVLKSCIRLLDNSEDSQVSVETLVFIKSYAKWMETAYAQICLPITLQRNELSHQLLGINEPAYFYNELMKNIPAELDARLWRVDVTVRQGDTSREFSFFTPANDDYEKIVYVDEMGLLHITNFEDDSSAFRLDCVESYTIVDAVTGDYILNGDTAYSAELNNNNNTQDNEGYPA